VLRRKLTYGLTLTDHISNPQNVGELTDADASAEETNPVCGDRMRLSLRIKEGRITEVRFLGYGCPPTIACGSILTEIIKNKLLIEALSLTRKDLSIALGGLPARKQHAAALAIETLHAALRKRFDS